MAAQEPNEIERLIERITRLMQELEQAERELALAIEGNLEVLARAREAAGIRERT